MSKLFMALVSTKFIVLQSTLEVAKPRDLEDRLGVKAAGALRLWQTNLRFAVSVALYCFRCLFLLLLLLLLLLLYSRIAVDVCAPFVA